jgi:hypothetical protein
MLHRNPGSRRPAVETELRKLVFPSRNGKPSQRETPYAFSLD